MPLWRKTMKVQEAKLEISAVSQKQYPKDLLPEIALAGRSNVGKSSFINTLIQRKSLARTSSKPGKTQTLNFYKINEQFYFVDVPGYGYVKVSKAERNKWGKMMEEYFEKRENLACVVLITDIRHKPTVDDQQMFTYLQYLELPTVVIATKVDKISRGKRNSFLARTKKVLNLTQDIPLIPFSAETGEGKDEVWRIFKQFI